jgi:hypothetical protein
MTYQASPGAFLNRIRPVALDNLKLKSFVDAAMKVLNMVSTATRNPGPDRRNASAPKRTGAEHNG